MEIFVQGHQFENDVRDVLYLFFARQEPVRAVCCLDNGECTTEITFGQATAHHVMHKDCDTVSQTKYLVKTCTFFACKKISNKQTPWGSLTGIRPTKFVRELQKKVGRSQAIEILQTEYFVSNEKAQLCSEVANYEDFLLRDIASNHVCLYIGIPFCPTKCSYCSFVSEKIEKSFKYMDEYMKLLLLEIEWIREFCNDNNRKVVSVYVGGGTPTSLTTYHLARLLHTLKQSFDFAEFTVEAGRPDTITRDKLVEMAKNGVSRLCINPQTLNDRTLQEIGRQHTVDQVFQCFKLARELGFDTINSDFIIGLPTETVDDFARTLDKLNHIKLESLTFHSLHHKRASRLDGAHSNMDADKCLKMADSFAREKEMLPYYMYRQKSTVGNLENISYAISGAHCLYNMLIMEEVAPIYAAGAGGVSKLLYDGKIQRVFNPKYAIDYIRLYDDLIRKKQEAYNDTIY